MFHLECLTRKCKEVKLQNEVVKVELSKKDVENKSLELTVSQLTTQISVRAKTISYSHILIKKLFISVLRSHLHLLNSFL